VYHNDQRPGSNFSSTSTEEYDHRCGNCIYTNKFGMLLSRSWTRKLGGTMQMYMTYAIIPIFGGDRRNFYSETRLGYVLNNKESPHSHLVYVAEDNMEVASWLF